MFTFQAIFASVIPGEVMRGSLGHMVSFPQWLGKNSTTNKTDRILQELRVHMSLKYVSVCCLGFYTNWLVSDVNSSIGKGEETAVKKLVWEASLKFFTPILYIRLPLSHM